MLRPFTKNALIETHCHIDLSDFSADRNAVLEAAWQAGLQAMVIPAILADDFDHLLALAATDERLFACCGLHPLFMAEHKPSDFERVAAHAGDASIVAIGECGLDYTRRDTDKACQKYLFEQHIELATGCNKPLIIHANKAVEDTVSILHNYPRSHGVVHSFNGSLQQAERLIAMNFKLGFGGAITYPRAKRLRQLLTQVPLSSLLLETDAPFQTGFAHSGERNQPAWLNEVATCIAELQQLPENEVANVTTASARELFGIQNLYGDQILQGNQVL